ncbi:MAG: hypothetical protein WA152_04105 [Microgenomates group bacterium]
MREFTSEERSGNGQAGTFVKKIESNTNLRVVGFAEESSVIEICNELGFNLAEMTAGGIKGFSTSLVIGRNESGEELIKIYESAGILVIRTPIEQ